MTGLELATRRARAGFSVNQLAEILGEHPDEVAKWETISSELPRSLRRRLDWTLAKEEREQAILNAGIPPCPVIQEMDRRAGTRFDLSKPEGLQALLAEIKQHAASCDLCKRREAFVATLTPLPPMPLSGTAGVLVSLHQGIATLPKWARPAAWGAIIVGAWTAARAVLLAVMRPGGISLHLLWIILAAIGIGAYGGAVGGLAYAAVRRPSRRLGRLGDYVTGIVVAYAYLLAFGLPALLMTHDDTVQSPIFWGIVAVVALVLGITMGHSMFSTKNEELTAPTS